MTNRPALTVIDGGRAHEPPRQRGPAPKLETLDLIRTLARADAMRMMGVPESDSAALSS